VQRPADEPTHHEPDEILHALDGPADQDLHLSGPRGDGTAEPDEPLLPDHDLPDHDLPDHDLPGGVDHTTAAVGAGGGGLALLGIAGFFKRRRNRRRKAALED
jgi:MYXO-CTERM domain-containing protein